MIDDVQKIVEADLVGRWVRMLEVTGGDKVSAALLVVTQEISDAASLLGVGSVLADIRDAILEDP